MSFQWGVKITAGNTYQDCGTSEPTFDLEQSGTDFVPFHNGQQILELMLRFADASPSEAKITFNAPEDAQGRPIAPITISKATITNIVGATEATFRWAWDGNNNQLQVWVGNLGAEDDQVDWQFSGTAGAPPAKLVITVKRDTTALNCT